MSPSTPQPRVRSRRARTVAAVATAGLAFTGLAVTAAQADVAAGDEDLPPLLIDGTVPNAGAIFFDDFQGNVQELGPVNSNTTKVGVIHRDALPTLATTNPNAQVDLRGVWFDTYTDAEDDDWLYFAWERDSTNGSGFIMYEFQQNPLPEGCDYSEAAPYTNLIANCNPWENRQPGDFILAWDQQGNSTAIYLRYFSDSDGGTFTKGDPLTLGAVIDLTAAGDAFAAYSPTKSHGEAAVNLTDTIFASGPGSCTTIGNVIPGTVTGNSDTADYKDTVLAPIADFLTISNCGSVTVEKVTVPEDGTGTFNYDLTRSGGGDLRYAADGYADLDSVAGTLTAHGDKDTIVNLIAGTDYTLAETFGADTPYDMTSIICTTEDGDEFLVDSSDPLATTVDFPVIEGETTACVITNTLQTGFLVVTKVVTNDHGGTATAPDFTFDVSGGIAADVPFEADGSNSFEVQPGSYTVTENGLPISGYTTSYANDANPNLNCDSLYVAPNATVTCTITNDDIAPQFTVIKVVTNDNGGTAVAGDFTMNVTATEPSDDSFPGAVAPGTTITLDAGAYSVAEAGVVGGQVTMNGVVYGVSYSTDCTGSIGIGESKTCTVTNDDTPASPAGNTTQSWVLHDSLTITGLRAGAPDAASATATFRLYSDTLCTVQVGSDESVGVSGTSAATAVGVAVTDSGTYYWRVQYSGDQYNNGFTTACGDEITQIQAKDHQRDDFAPPALTFE